MKLHLITVGRPKLEYARLGWQEYIERLRHYHSLSITHMADKHSDDVDHWRQAIGTSYAVALVIDGGRQFSSRSLADFLNKRAQDGWEVCFLIGGPEGLPKQVIATADTAWSFSDLTFPHDLAMVLLAESLYRASTINAGHPYHRA